MNDYPIGVLDSGIGGLTIFEEIKKQLPNESIIYLADSKNCPYGDKTSKEIYSLSKRLIQFLVDKKVKIIVVACNTITVSSLDKLRKDFPSTPIVGTVPVIKTASKLTKNGRIGILSTNKTVGSKYQKDLIKKFAKKLKVLNLGTDRLVPIVENNAEVASENFLAHRAGEPELKSRKTEGARPRSENFESSPRQVIIEELKPFVKSNIDVLVLGCSHFPFIKDEIGQILGKTVKILDSSGAVARQVKRILLINNAISRYNKPVFAFYTTGEGKRYKGVLKWERIIL